MIIKLLDSTKLDLEKPIKIVSIHPSSNLYYQRERFEGEEVVKVRKIIRRYENGDVGARIIFKHKGRRESISISRVKLKNI